VEEFFFLAVLNEKCVLKRLKIESWNGIKVKLLFKQNLKPALRYSFPCGNIGEFVQLPLSIKDDSVEVPIAMKTISLFDI
jgi:hypothetical protein